MDLRWSLPLVGAAMAACTLPLPEEGAASDSGPGIDAHRSPQPIVPDARTAPDARPVPDAIDVLLIFGYSPNYITALEGEMIAGALLADARIAQVDTIAIENLATLAPPAATLAPYDVVVYWWNDRGEQWPSARVDHGNVLADHVDAGGGVVTIGFAQGESSLLGRILTAGYLPLRPGAGPDTVTAEPASLVALAPDDPLLAEVSWVSAGIRPLAIVDPEAESIATWSDGVPAVARKGAVVSLGLRLDPADTALAGHWQALLANAVVDVAD